MFIHLIPGDPARLLAGKEATHEEIQMVREELGLNQPLYKQYFDYLTGLLQGDLGHSLKSGAPVSKLIGDRILQKLGLYFMSIICVFVFCILILMDLYYFI